jgi:hypothetical protein
LKAVNCHSGDLLEDQVTAASKEELRDALNMAAGMLRGKLDSRRLTISWW